MERSGQEFWSRPLGDPLRLFRQLYTWPVIIGVVAWLIGSLLPAIRDVTTGIAIGHTASAVGLTLVLCALAALPGRRTNAFYLRSFRNDARTGPVRVAVQNGLGRKFRLSGIRDPQRRWGHLWRHLGYVLFVFRYAS